MKVCIFFSDVPGAGRSHLISQLISMYANSQVSVDLSQKIGDTGLKLKIIKNIPKCLVLENVLTSPGIVYPQFSKLSKRVEGYDITCMHKTIGNEELALLDLRRILSEQRYIYIVDMDDKYIHDIYMNRSFNISDFEYVFIYLTGISIKLNDLDSLILNFRRRQISLSICVVSNPYAMSDYTTCSFIKAGIPREEILQVIVNTRKSRNNHVFRKRKHYLTKSIKSDIVPTIELPYIEDIDLYKGMYVEKDLKVIMDYINMDSEEKFNYAMKNKVYKDSLKLCY